MTTLDQALKKFNKDDWGDWVKANTVQFQPGDIFILGANTTSSLVYKAVELPEPNGYLKLHNWAWREQLWFGGHGWNMKTGGGIVSFFKGSGAALVKTANNGCVCRRCNARNEYAVSNQKDGSYICFECR